MQIHILGVWLGLVSFYGTAFTLLGGLPRYKKPAFCPNYFCLFDEIEVCVHMPDCVAKERNASVLDKSGLY